MYALVMKGNIYTSQRCPTCGGAMLHDDRAHNCVCATCRTAAHGNYSVRFGRAICKRFQTYPEAAQFLSGLRFKEAEGTFDRRDYQKDQPLSFRSQIDKWLRIKKVEVKPTTYRNLDRYIKKACAKLGIEGLDLYGGTRHTTVTAIAKLAGHDNARKASAHETNKAFERYCQAEDETAYSMARMIRGVDQPLIREKVKRIKSDS